MDLIEQAFKELYPEREFSYLSKVKYSGKFKDYNANIRFFRNTLELRLSKSWRKVNKNIRLGLIQSLILKILKGKKTTINIDLYNFFIKNLHLAVPKTKSDPELEQSFNRINQTYFYSGIEQPNLCWGHNSFRKLGSYDYQNDTITVSSIFKDQEQQLLDYIMYHELLHKKFKFNVKNGRSYHHTTAFKNAEKAFPDYNLVEGKLKLLTRKSRKKSFFSKLWFD